MRQLLDRIDPNHPSADTLRSAALRSIEVAERFNDVRSKIEKDGKFTTAGMQAALRESVPGFAAQLKAARAPIDRLDRQAKERRAAMKVRTPDKSDVSAALERQEIRTFVRELPQGERSAFLAGTKDLRVLEAVLSAPAQLSGVVAQPLAETIESRYLEMVYGAEGPAVAALENAIDEAKAIAKVARTRLQIDSGLDPRSFDGVAGPAEQKAVPWLVKSGDSKTPLVVDIDDNGKANYRVASQWEQQAGQFFKDEAEYKAAHGEAA